MKKEDELKYQKKWAGVFSKHKDLVLEYWKKYRYFYTIESICQPNENKKILDVGCGISSILHFIKGQKYGIDALIKEYRTLYQYPNTINTIPAKAESIPFKNETFDIIFCSNAYDHVDNIELARKEIYRVLKPEGYFVLAVEFFKQKKVRDSAHPYCLLKEDVYNLTNEYLYLYQRITPWVGLKEHILGVTQYDEEELLFILQKRI